MKPILETRRCPRCRAVLSRYNRDPICAPCRERERQQEAAHEVAEAAAETVPPVPLRWRYQA